MQEFALANFNTACIYKRVRTAMQKMLDGDVLTDRTIIIEVSLPCPVICPPDTHSLTRPSQTKHASTIAHCRTAGPRTTAGSTWTSSACGRRAC